MPVADEAAECGKLLRILFGAGALAAHVYGEDTPKTRRKIYHLTSEVAPKDRLPTFKLGGIICGRPETIEAWIAAREGGAR